MHYLIQPNRYSIFTLCFCWIFSYSLEAQNPNVISFELSQYEFQAGNSEHLELRLTMKGAPANVLEIQNPIENAAMVVESIKRVDRSNSAELWLTKDSILFAKNIPQTAWVTDTRGSTVIRTASALQSGDQIVIRLLIAVPKYDQKTAKDNVQTNSSSGKENFIFVAVSHSTSPEAVSTYKSSKPFLIKYHGSAK